MHTSHVVDQIAQAMRGGRGSGSKFSPVDIRRQLATKLGRSSPEELCVRITGLGLYIKCSRDLGK